MEPALTRIGTQMSALTGVRAIMKDIIETLRNSQGKTFINLSAGNPVILPEVEQLWRTCTLELLNSPEYGEVVCRYGASQGYAPLVDAFVAKYTEQPEGAAIEQRHAADIDAERHYAQQHQGRVSFEQRGKSRIEAKYRPCRKQHDHRSDQRAVGGAA